MWSYYKEFYTQVIPYKVRDMKQEKDEIYARLTEVAMAFMFEGNCFADLFRRRRVLKTEQGDLRETPTSAGSHFYQS